VLRLDLQGYGSSHGDLEEVGFLDWVSDIKAAIRFLESIVGKGNVGLIGLRLGANMAMYSASTSTIRLLVLCDPIIDFTRYFNLLLRRKAISEMLEKGGKQRTIRGLRDKLNREGQLDIGGYVISKRLYQEIQDYCGRISPIKCPTLLLHREQGRRTSRAINGLREVLASDGGECKVKTLHYEAFWERPGGPERGGELIPNIVNWIKDFKGKRTDGKKRETSPALLSNSIFCETREFKAARQGETPVSFASDDGASLLGIIHIPNETACRRDMGVIVLPGWTESASGPHQMYTKLARRLCDTGFYCLRFDYRGRGDSEGDWDMKSRQTEFEDLVCAASFFKERTGIRRIALVGKCTGGKLALRALLRNEAFNRVVLWSPASFGIETGNDLKRTLSVLKKWMRKLRSGYAWKGILRGEYEWKRLKLGLLGGLNLKPVFHMTLGHLPLFPKRRLRQPGDKLNPRLSSSSVLLVYGAEDVDAKVFVPAYSTLFKKYNIPYKETSIKGADSSFSATEWENAAIGITVHWLEEWVEVG